MRRGSSAKKIDAARRKAVMEAPVTELNDSMLNGAIYSLQHRIYTGFGMTEAEKSAHNEPIQTRIRALVAEQTRRREKGVSE